MQRSWLGLGLFLLAAAPLAARAQDAGSLASAPATRAAFQPERLRIAPGVSASALLRVEPAADRSRVWIEAPAGLRWTRSGDRLAVEGVAPGRFTLRARLGQGGPVLAALEVQVLAPLLERVLERVRAEVLDGGRTPIVVFDLDDTLFDTRWRTLAVLRAWGQARGEPRLAGLELEEVRYDLADTLAAAGFAAWEIRGALGREVASHEARYRHEYQLARPFPGAREYVLDVEQAGARVAYVTGRSVAYRALSESVLRAHGFPVEGALRYYRLDAQGTTAAWKGRIARQELARHGEVVACLDNEPANANAFLQAAPAALHGFLDTQHSSGAPRLLVGIEAIEGWSR